MFDPFVENNEILKSLIIQVLHYSGRQLIVRGGCAVTEGLYDSLEFPKFNSCDDWRNKGPILLRKRTMRTMRRTDDR